MSEINVAKFGINPESTAARIYPKYIDALMRGESQSLAARAAGVAVEKIDDFIRTASIDHRFRALLADALDGLELEQLWSDKLHVLALLRIVNSPFAKDMQRLQALDRLAALYKIDTVDVPLKNPNLDWRALLNTPKKPPTDGGSSAG